MTDEKLEIESKSDRTTKKIFSRIFIIVLIVVLFTSWLLVGLDKSDIMYAVYVSLGVLGSWIVIVVGRAINERNLSLKSERSGKPYVAEEMGVLSAMPDDEVASSDMENNV
ncbi:MAG: hypothetical protein K8S87_07725 [Planctomycetes bacterium]|nr:hypothetical protein [Planctomycetota bacterium]